MANDPTDRGARATRTLADLGQRLWLDGISRELLMSGRLARYIDEYSISGLTSNPTIFERAIVAEDAYYETIAHLLHLGVAGEALFEALAVAEIGAAADALRSRFDASGGQDGWASLEVSPLLAASSEQTISAAARLHEACARPNVFIKIAGTPAGLEAIEASIFAGIPINVTLLFSREQYLAAADAYMRGLERRRDAGLDLGVASVASLFVSRWDVAVQEDVAQQYHHRLGIAIAMQAYRAYRELLGSARWQALQAAGAKPQKLLWASTGSKDAAVADTLYVEALAAPETIITMPEKTLLAFADHGRVDELLPADGGYSENVIEEFRRENLDLEAIAERLQEEGIDAFVKSWQTLLTALAERARAIATRG